MNTSTYLITGGTTGIGLATAQLLSADGARVVVTGRNPATLAAARDQLPAGSLVLASDSGSITAAQALGSELQKQGVTRLDGAFFNAGIGQFGSIDEMTPKHFEDMFGVNVRGLYFQLQSVLPLLQRPSTVVFNASVVAELGFPTTSLYSATKAAVVSLGKSLAVELAPRGIRVNTLSPGPIKTPIYAKLGFPSEAQQSFEDGMAAQSLFKRFGEAGEVAKLARFLLTNESSYIIGENITVDGGVRLT